MTPAAQCETHNFVVKTPKTNEATTEELQEMTEKFAKHIYLKGVQTGYDGATHILGGAKENIKPCKVKYYSVTPSDL